MVDLGVTSLGFDFMINYLDIFSCDDDPLAPAFIIFIYLIHVNFAFSTATNDNILTPCKSSAFMKVLLTFFHLSWFSFIPTENFFIRIICLSQSPIKFDFFKLFKDLEQ